MPIEDADLPAWADAFLARSVAHPEASNSLNSEVRAVEATSAGWQNAAEGKHELLDEAPAAGLSWARGEDRDACQFPGAKMGEITPKSNGYCGGQTCPSLNTTSCRAQLPGPSYVSG